VNSEISALRGSKRSHIRHIFRLSYV